MEEKITTEEKEFTVTHADGTTSQVKGTVTTTNHGETDAEGNPKVSVHIGASPIGTPAPAPIHLTPGDQIIESTEQ